MDRKTYENMVKEYTAQLMAIWQSSPNKPATVPAQAAAPGQAQVHDNPPESGAGEDPLQPFSPQAETFEEFLQHNPGRGALRIQATSGRRAVPVENAKVTVSKEFTDGKRIFAEVTTDKSGIADGIVLPAPQATVSQEPSAQPPYASYDITVSHPGYIEEHYIAAPVFAGIKSIQPVHFMPLQPENA